jgi:membrane protease YdiL (CAAX protease family)
MAIPYVMVHFNKPLPETFGALGAAMVLGALALRAGSCVPGIFVHWAVGMTMDVSRSGSRWAASAVRLDNFLIPDDPNTEVTGST